MHPLISLISFMLFSACISLGSATALIIGCSLILFVCGVSRQWPSKKAWQMIKRLKIFFISIFVIYLWFTPGQLVFPTFDQWSPTYEGIITGAERVIALCLLVIAVELLLRLMSRSEILCGLYYLAFPLQRFGLNRERFIIRMILTLDAVAEIGSGNRAKTDQPRQELRRYLETVSDKLVARFDVALMEEENLQELRFDLIPLPVWYQWLLPIGILALFMMITS